MLLTVPLVINFALTWAQPARSGLWTQGWLLDEKAAFARAQDQQRQVLMYFTFTSDRRTRILEGQVFPSPVFRQWLQQRQLIPLLVTYQPQGAKQDENYARFAALIRQYQVPEVPTVILVNGNGQKLSHLDAATLLTETLENKDTRRINPQTWLRRIEQALTSKGAIANPGTPKRPGPTPALAGKGWTGRQVFIDSQAGAMNYSLFVPRNLKPGQRYPLVVELHGGVTSHGTFFVNEGLHEGQLSQPEIQAHHPFFILVPQALPGQNWTSHPARKVLKPQEMPQQPTPSMRLVMKLINQVIQKYPIASDRLVLRGRSGGGYGSWAFLHHYPDRFYGASINCGGGDPAKVAASKGKRIWMFHGMNDHEVSVRYGDSMFAALMLALRQEPRKTVEGDWIKLASPGDTIRYWKHKKGGHVTHEAPLKEQMNWMFSLDP